MKLFWVVLVLAVTAGAVRAYDPPRIIGVLSARPERHNFGLDFCCIGDQNGDGYDDLLVNEFAFQNQPPSRVYLFQGGDTISNDAGYTFTSYEEGLTIGRGVFYIGRMLGRDQGPKFGICSIARYRNSRIDIYDRDMNLEDQPSETLTIQSTETAPWHDEGYRNKELDFNGDGYSDVAFLRIGVGFLVYYGGADPDTNADWSVPLLPPYWSGGWDINGDNIGDIIMFTTENDNSWYSIFLGGNPPDTIPAVRIRAMDNNLTENFAMLPDINGDGYDELGVYWYTANPMRDGFKVFLGAEEPDGEPDINLEGSREWYPDGGRIAGGDFNGDGFGDIALATFGGPPAGETSELMLYFGNRWMSANNEEPRSDIYLNMMHDYNGLYPMRAGRLGAAGDYNGDGIDDFVYGGGIAGDATVSIVIIFAGDRGWHVGVKEDQFQPREFSMSMEISPNPFNTTTTLSFSLPSPLRADLAIYDLSGRMVTRLLQGELQAGAHSFIWNAEAAAAGIYLVKLEAGPPDGGLGSVKKLVLVK